MADENRPADKAPQNADRSGQFKRGRHRSDGQAHRTDETNSSPASGKYQRGTDQNESVDASRGASSHDEGKRVRDFQQRQTTGSGEKLFAALDLGTNNCRLLIAQPTRNSFRVIGGFSKIVRLGEGLSQSGRLSDEAMTRALQALKACRNRLQSYNISHQTLIATQACRIAENGEEFLARVKNDTGLKLDIIDRETEARLAVTGCADLIDKEADGAILFDIGGGSSELAWLDFKGGRPKEMGKMTASMRSWKSMPFGVVTIAEKFGGVDVSPELFEEMVAHVAQHLKTLRNYRALGQSVRNGNVHLLGTSGTVTTLAGLYLGLERYDRRKVDGLWMKSIDIEATMRALLRLSYDDRVANACIGPDRADLVIPGCAIFEAIRREWNCENLRIADRGLREGLLVEMMSREQVWSGSKSKSPSTQRRERRKNKQNSLPSGKSVANDIANELTANIGKGNKPNKSPKGERRGKLDG